MNRTQVARIRKRDARVKANARKRCKHDGINRVILGNAVRERITRLGLSRDEAAKIVKDAASQMSRLMTFHDDEFSADRLVKMLVRLGCSVNVNVYGTRERFTDKSHARRAMLGRGRVQLTVVS